MTLQNDSFMLSSILKGATYQLNSHGYFGEDFKAGTGVCVGACDIAGFRSTFNEKYWSEYFPEFDQLGNSGGVGMWLLDKLEIYVREYRPSKILMMVPRLTAQFTLQVNGRIVSIVNTGDKLLRFLCVNRLISKFERDYYLNEISKITLNDIIENEPFSEFSERLERVVGDIPFKWTHGQTRESLPYWESGIDRLCDSAFMRSTYVPMVAAIDFREDGSIGPMTSLNVANSFKKAIHNHANIPSR